MNKTSPLLERDKKYTWHPFTQEKTAPAPLPVVKAKDVWLELDDGHRLVDAISSWWTNVHGHAHPLIASAIAEQAQTLDHVLFAGCTHPGAVDVAEELVRITPEGLNRAFFSDNGSTAVEVALKMTFQYWQNRGQPERTQFIALEHAYHGDTIGAMSAGDPDDFGGPFKQLFFPVDRFAAPRVEDGQAGVDAALAALDALLDKHDATLGAIIIEPMVQGAGGMIMSPPAFLKGLAQRARSRGILLIADEVMTGFGRTGKLFAVEHADVTPDIMCVAKGLTGGILPLAVTLATDEIYEAFFSDDTRKAFLHGHSFTANPIACAAARASLQVFREEPVLERIAKLEEVYRARLPKLAEHPKVKHTRWLGSIGVVELSAEGGYYNQVGNRVREAFHAKGYLVRPLGTVIYTLPPYVLAPAQLHALFDELEIILDSDVV